MQSQKLETTKKERQIEKKKYINRCDGWGEKICIKKLCLLLINYYFLMDGGLRETN